VEGVVSGDGERELAVRLVAMAVDGAREIGQVEAAGALSLALATYAEMCGVLPENFERFMLGVVSGYRATLKPRDGERVN
jgi:hypothetical protein